MKKKWTAKSVLQNYGKGIMTVMSIMLMLIFALPNMKGKTAEDLNYVAMGHLNGVKVTVDEINGAKSELEILKAFDLLNSAQYGYAGAVLAKYAPEESDRPQYWYLLRAEAAKYSGTVYTEADALQVLGGVQTRNRLGMISNGYTTSEIDDTLERLGISRKPLAVALSDIQSVENYVQFVFNLPRPISSFDLAADTQLRQIQVSFAAINGIQDWNQAAEPTADQLAAQFDAYKKVVPTRVYTHLDVPILLGVQKDPLGTFDKPYVALIGFPDDIKNATRAREDDVLPWDGSKVVQIILRDNGASAILLSGGGRSQATAIVPGLDLHGRSIAPQPAEINGHHFPFGYKYPDRVKVQYMVFNRDDIRKTIPVTDAITQKAFEAYKAIKDKMPATTQPVAVTVPATASQPGSSLMMPPVATASAPAVMTWETKKDEMIKVEVDKEVNRLLRKMVDWVRNRTEAPFRNTDWKTTTAPAVSQWADYAKLADDFAKVGDFNKYKPAVKDSGNAFLPGEKLELIPGIGQGLFTTNQGEAITFPTLAASVGELVELDKRSELGRLNLHVGVDAPEVTDKDGNVYLFRVTSVDKTHEPASLAEDKAGVPDAQIKQNVIEDFKKLSTYTRKAKEVKEALAKSDVAAIAAQFKVEVQKPKDFSRIETSAPLEVQGIRGFVKAAFALQDPGTPKAIASLENDSLFQIVPMQLTRVSAATGQDYGNAMRSMDPMEPSLFRMPEPATITFVDAYLDVNAIAARIKYVPVTPFAKKNQ